MFEAFGLFKQHAGEGGVAFGVPRLKAGWGLGTGSSNSVWVGRVVKLIHAFFWTLGVSRVRKPVCIFLKDGVMLLFFFLVLVIVFVFLKDTYSSV